MTALDRIPKPEVVTSSELNAEPIKLDPEARAAQSRAQAEHERGLLYRRLIDDPLTPDDERKALARMMRDVNRARTERGEPRLDDVYGLIARDLDREEERSRLISGGTFALDIPDEVPAIWGEGSEVLWSQGEPLIITGPTGVGKTTLAFRLVLARVGIGSPDVLGWNVAPTDDRPVLYLAADRPRQVARNLRRMTGEADRARLDAGLRIWSGPLDYNIGTNPDRFAEWCAEQNVGTVVLDSLKDLATPLSDESIGQGVKRALSLLEVAGIETLVLHHQRKASKDGTRPRALDDVYGSTWITAGAGSVLLLWGKAGDPVITLDHLKQPSEPIGPLEVIHHPDGRLEVHRGSDLLGLLRRTPQGLTARDAARLMNGQDDPDKASTEKARRQLAKLEQKGLADRKQGRRGGDGGSEAARWHATETTPAPS